jgi:hypothetical protein
MQAEHVRLIPLGIDRQGDDGLDAEALRQLGRHRTLRRPQRRRRMI